MTGKKKNRVLTGPKRIKLIDELRALADEEGHIDETPAALAKLMSVVIEHDISSAVIKKQMGDLELTYKADVSTPLARITEELRQQREKVEALSAKLKKVTGYLGIDG